MENPPPQVTVVQKSNFGCRLAMIIVGSIVASFLLIVGGCFAVGIFGAATVSEAVVKVKNERAEIASGLKIVDFTWRNASGVNVMEASFKIKNTNSFDVKDIRIECNHFSESGTRIDSNTRTVYEVIKAGETKEFKKFNMGFIHSQATKSVASVTSAEKAE